MGDMGIGEGQTFRFRSKIVNGSGEDIGQPRRECTCENPIPLSIGVCGYCCGKVNEDENTNSDVFRGDRDGDSLGIHRASTSGPSDVRV